MIHVFVEGKASYPPIPHHLHGRFQVATFGSMENKR